jgi:hypothetical protein
MGCIVPPMRQARNPEGSFMTNAAAVRLSTRLELLLLVKAQRCQVTALA